MTDFQANNNIVLLEQSFPPKSITESINIQSSAEVILNQNQSLQSSQTSKVPQSLLLNQSALTYPLMQTKDSDQSHYIIRHQQNVESKKENSIENSIQINKIQTVNQMPISPIKIEGENAQIQNQNIEQSIKPQQKIQQLNQQIVKSSLAVQNQSQQIQPTVIHQSLPQNQNQILTNVISVSNNQNDLKNSQQLKVSIQQQHKIQQSYQQSIKLKQQSSQIKISEQQHKLQQSIQINRQTVQTQIKSQLIQENINQSVNVQSKIQTKIQQVDNKPQVANQITQVIQQKQIPNSDINPIIQQIKVQKEFVEEVIKQQTKQNVQIKQIKEQPIKLPTFQELIKRANDVKAKGNQYFKNKQFQSAIKTYTEALHVVDPKLFNSSSPQIYQSMIELNLVLLTNISSSYFQIKNYDVAERFSTQVLQINPKHFKALYRRALCYYQLKKYEQSLKDIKAAHAIDPKNQIIEWYNKIYNEYKIEAQERKKSEKELYKVMFNKSQSQTSQKSIESPKKVNSKEKQEVPQKQASFERQLSGKIEQVPQKKTEINQPQCNNPPNSNIIKKVGAFAALGTLGSFIVSRNIEDSQQKLGLIATTTIGSALLGTQNNFYKALGGLSLAAAGYYLFNKFR